MLDARAEDADVDEHDLGAAETGRHRQRQVHALNAALSGHGIAK